MKETIKKFKFLVTTIEGLMAIVFGALFIAAVVSIAKGAWWHIVTAVISGPLCYMMFLDVKDLYEEEEQYYNGRMQ